MRSTPAPILIRQVTYLSSIVEQEDRAIERVTGPMLNFKSFRSACLALAGNEPMHMIRKGRFAVGEAVRTSCADHFFALAGQVRSV